MLAALEVVLVSVLAIQSARVVWALAAPAAPPAMRIAPAPTPDFSVLTRFDPFFRGEAAAASADASQGFRLFGVRVYGPRGSAIIAGPDGRQNSVGVGEEVSPGVRLQAVAADHVVLSRGGAATQLHFPEGGAQ
ncbi:MAG TPA: type II secretion system protein N [Caulobacteraceae bacterium]|nr:type II secretion system protein N [Caulobacteraceae bacterium]